VGAEDTLAKSSQSAMSQLQSPEHIWNVNAPVFSTPAQKSYSEIKTQTEYGPYQQVNCSTQTECNVQMSSCGTQYENVETKSVGIECKLLPQVKSKYIQASVVMKNQCTGGQLSIKDSTTQVNKF
jgi:hypothetical protein